MPRNLQAVRLGHNKLKTIPDGVFNTKLAYLGLAANPISKAERAKLQEKLPKTKIFFLPTTPQIIVAAVGTIVALLVVAAGTSRYVRRLEQQNGLNHSLVGAVDRADAATIDVTITDLIGQGANVNAADVYDQNGRTPLEAAASRGIVSIVLLLIDKGAIVNQKAIDAASDPAIKQMLTSAQAFKRETGMNFPFELLK